MEDWLVEDQATLRLNPINKKYMNFPPIGYGTLEPLRLEPQQVQPQLVSSSIKLFKSRRKHSQRCNFIQYLKSELQREVEYLFIRCNSNLPKKEN